jgi:CHASE3 domain sensor protein
VNAEVASLRGLVVDNGPEVARVDLAEDTVRVRMVELTETVSAAHQAALPRRWAGEVHTRGRGLMDAARGLLADMEAPERRLLGEREAVSQAAFSRLLLGLYGGGALLLFLTVGAAMLTRRDFMQLKANEAQ